MKKIVAILMVLALVAGAFAADISAALNTGIVAVMDADNSITLNGLYDGQDGGDGFNDANLLKVSVDGEKAGAFFKIRGFSSVTSVKIEDGKAKTDTVKGTKVHKYGVWFKPIDMLKFTVGNDNTVGAFDSACFGWWTPLGIGISGGAGWSAELTPIDPLYIGFHMCDAVTKTDNLKSLDFIGAVKYSIDGFGTIGLEAAHANDCWGEWYNDTWATYNAVALGANISALEAASFNLVGTAYFFDKEDGEGFDPMYKVEASVNASVGADIYFLSRTLIRTTKDNDKLGEVLFARADYYLDNLSIYGLCGFGMNVAEASETGFGSADANDVAAGDIDSTQLWIEAGVPISFDTVTVTPAFVFKSSKFGDADAKNKWYLPIRVSIEF